MDRLTRVDSDGVPTIVQRIHYSWTQARWTVSFFDGTGLSFSSSELLTRYDHNLVPWQEAYWDMLVKAEKEYWRQRLRRRNGQ